MKISKAIEILSCLLADRQDLKGTDLSRSFHLAVEALKRIDLWRECGDEVDISPLSGEDPE